MRISIIILLLFYFCFFVTAQTTDTVNLYGKVDDFINTFKYQESLKLLLEAEKRDSANFQTLQRISRVYVHIGENLPEDTPELEERQEEYYNKALTYAEKAIKLAPGKSINYLRRAIANGKIALFKGVFTVAGVVNKVREDAEKSIALNTGSKAVIASSHYVLGRTHAKISEKWKPARSVLGLGWADIDSALVHFQKAIDMRPGYIMYYIDYAKALIEEDEYEKAREMLNKVAKCEEQDQQDAQRKKEAIALLKEIENE
jgi:tetratricopeptide (TPR) repeat protein